MATTCKLRIGRHALSALSIAPAADGIAETMAALAPSKVVVASTWSSSLRRSRRTLTSSSRHPQPSSSRSTNLWAHPYSASSRKVISIPARLLTKKHTTFSEGRVFDIQI